MAATAKTTKKDKPKKVRPGDLLVEKFLAEAEARRKADGMSPEAAAAQQQFDLEAAELFRQTNGQADHAPTLGVATTLGRIAREGDGGAPYDRIRNWVPPLAVDPELLKPFAAEIAGAKQRVEEARFKEMNEAEQELYFLQKEQTKALAELAAAEDHAKWLESSEVKTTLAKLQKLDSDTAVDADWSWSDTVAIARAILAIETAGADRAAALALANEAFSIATQKKVAAMTQREKEVERLRAEIDLLNGKPADSKPDAKPDAKPAAAQPPVDAALLTELKAAEEAYFNTSFSSDPAAWKAAGERYDVALNAVESKPAE